MAINIPTYTNPNTLGNKANQPQLKAPSNTLPANQVKPGIGGLLGTAWNNTIKPAIGAGIASVIQQPGQNQQVTPGFAKTFNLPQVVKPESIVTPSAGNQGAISYKGSLPPNASVPPPAKTLPQLHQDKIDAHDAAIKAETARLAQEKKDKETAMGNTGNVQIAGSTTGASSMSPVSDTSKSSTPPVDYQGLYGQLIKQLQDRANTSNPTQTSAQQGLLNTASQSQDYKDAQAEANRIAAERAKLTQDYAQKDKNIQGTAGFLTQATGLEGLLNRQYGLGQEALSQQEASATSRLNAANQQQQVQQQGFTGAGNLANTQQANQLAGLNNAADLARPTGNIINVNPITGQPIAGGSLNDLARTAGTISGIQSGAATAAATGGNIESQQQTQIAAYQSALQQGQHLQSQLNDLITTFGLNPSNLNAVNAGMQKIAQNTSDPHYKQLQNYVNDIANTYAQILTPTGGSQTDTTRSIASSMLDATASGTSIMDTMKSLDNAAQAKISGVPTNQNGNTNTTSNKPKGWF